MRGVVAILIGLVALVLPIITLAALALLFGAYAFVDGVLSLIAVMKGGLARDRWWALLLEGLIGIGAGVVTVIWPGITVLALLYVIAFWAIVTGVLEIMAAVRLRKHMAGEWLLILAGIASLVFGILLLVAPGPGAVVVGWWIGAYALIFGVVMLALSFRLRSWSKSPAHA